MAQSTQPDGVHNKLLNSVAQAPGRIPSPQPTHLSVPGSNHQLVVEKELVVEKDEPGYVAPKFEGKERQMEEYV